MKNKVWKTKLIFRIFELAKNGYNDENISSILGIKSSTFFQWKKKKRLVRIALKIARRKKEKKTLNDFIFEKLSPDLKIVWNKINGLEKKKNGMERIEYLLEKKGKYARQSLFLYALVNTNYSFNKSLKIVNITKRIFDEWCNEPEFYKLINELEWYRKNWLEDSLMSLIAEGNKEAILFANRNINRDRGYNDSKNINIKNENIHRLECNINIDELNLPIDVRKIILEAIRNRKSIASNPVENNLASNSIIPIENKNEFASIDNILDDEKDDEAK